MLLSEGGGTRRLCLIVTTQSEEGGRPCHALNVISRPPGLARWFHYQHSAGFVEEECIWSKTNPSFKLSLLLRL